MSEYILARSTNGVLYKIPPEIAENYVVNKDDAQKLFETRSAFNAALKEQGIVTQLDSSQLPDFNVLLQTEYAD
ncbi:hypothetical protein LC612_44025 [Nostoc sp. CHAB 5834]|nr:hypothetical protein [Nostoc sp. CHAB 5834]